MLSNGMRIAYGIVGSLKIASAIGLSVVLQQYLKIINDATDSSSLADDLISFVPIGILWGMVVPLYLNGFLGVLAAAIAKVPACAVYLTFCILGLLAGIPLGSFSIIVAIASVTDDDLINCSWFTGSATDCIDDKLSSLGTAVAAIHAVGWILTLIGSIFGCVGSCCSASDNPQTVYQQQMTGFGPTVAGAPPVSGFGPTVAGAPPVSGFGPTVAGAPPVSGFGPTAGGPPLPYNPAYGQNPGASPASYPPQQLYPLQAAQPSAPPGAPPKY